MYGRQRQQRRSSVALKRTRNKKSTNPKVPKQENNAGNIDTRQTSIENYFQRKKKTIRENNFLQLTTTS